MLVVETIAKIRRGFFRQGKSIKAICRELGISRKVVRKVIRSGATEFRYEREDQPLPKIGRWRDTLDQLLSANEAKASRERLTLSGCSKNCAGAAMTAATMRFAAMPGDGPRSADKRRLRLTSR